MQITANLTAQDLVDPLERMWRLSGAKLKAIADRYDWASGPPVCTAAGRYGPRAWTDWTEGFAHGSAILQFDVTGDEGFLVMGRSGALERMSPHITDFGVHDHGFNIVSTYGNLWRLAQEGRSEEGAAQRRLYELALCVSGAVQAKRWTRLGDGRGYICSFNGAHSLFIDTLRSLRSLALAHVLGQTLRDENGGKTSLLERLLQHATSTARFCVYYGQGRDIYDVRGRVAHEAIFNTADGSFRCSSTQQGFSPYSTWARGLSWAMCGFAEQLEFLLSVSCRGSGDAEDQVAHVVPAVREAAEATCDYYIDRVSAADGVPYWDDGAPGLAHMPDWRTRPADPYNDHEPVDSSAAAVAAQGLLRLGLCTGAERYVKAGLSVASTLLQPPYLSDDDHHEGLLLHSIYHRPRGWDQTPPGRKVPSGESSMWGDYHLRELGVILARLAVGTSPPNFFAGTDGGAGQDGTL
jgi:unsaturated chondroitin disaccharide hydrolase